MSELTGRAHVVEVPPSLPNQPLSLIRPLSPLNVQRQRLLKLIQQMTPPRPSPSPLDQSQDYTPYVDENPIQIQEFSPYKPSRMPLSIKELQRYRVPHMYKIPSKKYDSELRQTVLSESSLSIEVVHDESDFPQPRCTLLMNLNTQLKNLPSYANNPRFTKTFELLEEEEEKPVYKDHVYEIYSNTTGMNAPTGIESSLVLSREEQFRSDAPSLIEEESFQEQPLQYKICPYPQELQPYQISDEESSEIPVLSGKMESFHAPPYKPQECETPEHKEFTFAGPSGSASTKATRSPEHRIAVKCEEPQVYSETPQLNCLKVESKILSPSSPIQQRRQSTIRSKELMDCQFLNESPPQRRLSHYGMNSHDLWNTLMKSERQKSPQVCYSSGDSHYHSALGPSQLSLVDSYNREHESKEK